MTRKNLVLVNKGTSSTAEWTGAGLVSLTMPFNQHSGAIYLR